MKILHERDSPLLNRKSLVLEIEYPKSPTLPRAEIKKRIAEKFKVDQNLISIQKIKTKFGGKLLQVSCNIYKDEKMLKYFEVKKKKEQVKQENGGKTEQLS